MRNLLTRANILILVLCALVIGALVFCFRGGLGTHQPHENQPSQTSRINQSVSPAQQQLAQEQNAEHAAATPTNPSSAALPSVASQGAPAPHCFYESFHHKPTPGHTDEEACSRHKNLLRLAHSNVNPNHLCVRVNGTPVKYERKGDEILIGSIAGPKAKITVSYCIGKSSCNELAKDECKIPKDEFMEALGGDTDSPDSDSAQWGGNAQLNADVKKELQGINELDNDGDRAPAQANVFKDWIRDQDAQACPMLNGKQPS
jgi:hypothetical protein